MKDKSPARKIVTVRGLLDPQAAGITDAHNHVWIDPVPGVSPGAPILDNMEAIMAELSDYRQAGGGSIVDCQPGGCGRNVQMLRALAQASGVNIIACTGYHLRKYYPPDAWLFQATAQAAEKYFRQELQEGLDENPAVRAGFIKIACEATLEQSPRGLMEAAAEASRQTGAAIQVHTEKGACAEQILKFFLDRGLSPVKLILAHVDKRPDYQLHRTLAQEGVLLEYDTFYREKYHPEINLWPLLARMVGAGLVAQIAVATDMAEAVMWKSLGGKPGMAALISEIIPRMQAIGFSAESIRQLTGGNIAACLARITDYEG